MINNRKQWFDYLKYEEIDQRLPIITIMGHVDHGKTTLIEQLLKQNNSPKNLTAGEPGGISQNIALYKLPYALLVDTPGHEVFSLLRSTLMEISDIVILVIACDDGIQSQTIDIIKKAPENTCFLVAINKIDKGERNLNNIYGQLAGYGIYTEHHGGDTLTTNISAKNNIGIDALIENIKLQWELLDHNKTRKNGYAIGNIMDCKLQKGIGYITSIVMKAGTLNQGDDIVMNGEVYRIKAINENGKSIKSCTVDQVVELIGISKPMLPGTPFASVKDSKLMEILVPLSLEDSQEEIVDQDKCFILQTNSVVKLDTLKGIFKNRGKILEAVVSNVIKDSSMELAKSTGAIVILWGDYSDSCINKLKKMQVPVISHEIIYKILEDLEEKKAPEEIMEETGVAKLKKVFIINNSKIAGCVVSDGKVCIGNKCLIRRNNSIMAKGHITSMKRERDTIRESLKNTECGLIIAIDEIVDKTYDGFMENDNIVCYIMKQK